MGQAESIAAPPLVCGGDEGDTSALSPTLPAVSSGSDTARALQSFFDLDVSAEETATAMPQAASVVRAYFNRNTSESFNSSLGSQVEFRLSCEDLNAPWFCRLGTRALAHELLADAPSGSFLLRPSSHRGMYALSWKKGLQIRDKIVYCCWPGYALKKNPLDCERYHSLGSLVAHCPFLVAPCVLPSDLQQRAERVLLQQLYAGLQQMGAAAAAAMKGEEAEGSGVDFAKKRRGGKMLQWELCILEALDTYMTPELCERRTSLGCGSHEFVFPALFPMTELHARSLAALLRPQPAPAPAMCWIESLVLIGFQGMGRHNCAAAVSDETLEIICEALRRNETVLTLDVSTNTITDRGAAAVAALLAAPTRLRQVKIANNFITAAGLVQLAAGLRRNKSLDELVLSPQMQPGTSPPAVSQDAEADRVAGALCNSLKRKHELFQPTDKGSYRLHGLLSDAAAADMLLAVRPSVPCLYILYLCATRPDSVQLAYTVSCAGGVAVRHRTIYRHNCGYSFAPAIASLTRHAAWRSWAAGVAGCDMPHVLAEELAASEELFCLWRCEQIEDAGCGAEESAGAGDPWLGQYPTLFFLTSALRAHLKIGLNLKPHS